MSASEGKLGELHNKVAEVLTKALDGQVLEAVADEDGAIVQEETVIPPSAAVIVAAIQFLKSNNITCAPAEDNAIGALEAKMRARQEKRAARAQPNVIDFEQAREDASFIGNKLTGTNGNP